MAARDLILYYRFHHGINGSTLYLFNHESERRPKEFFIPKIIEILIRAMHDQDYKGSVETLDFDCDWGSAEEFMDIIVDISEKVASDDFVLGTGKTWHARNFVETLFRLHHLNYNQHILTENQDNALSPSKLSYRVIMKKLEKAIHRLPQCSILEVCTKILQQNYNLFSPIREDKL